MSRIAAEDGRLVFVGNLPNDVREREIDDLFYKYGRIRDVALKTPARPPPYCFVEFEDRRDAEDAVRGRDGYDFYGCRLRVELAGGRKNDRGGRSDRDRGDYRSGGGYRDDRGRDRDRPPRRERDFKPRSTGFRVIIKGLPASASWQDLKDFIRKVVKPVYTDVKKQRDGVLGVAEFSNGDDMALALRELDDTEFRNADDTCMVRIYEDREQPSGGGDKARSRSRSPKRRDSPRRSRSRSPMQVNRSPSPPRGRSRSPKRRHQSRSPSRERRGTADSPIRPPVPYNPHGGDTPNINGDD